MPDELTEEQLEIVRHPLGKHARVLAVAGSGKTTTMVHRIVHLVENLNQDPRRIRVLMFNRRAREDFERKLAEQLFEQAKRPKVQTFHSIAHEMIRLAQRDNLLQSNQQIWEDQYEELALICMHRAIDSLIRDGIIEDDVDPEEALDAVGLWKASLIPPERAGHHNNPDLPFVYRRFEEFRNQGRGITYDDFVPMALHVAAKSSRFRDRWSNCFDHLIVDEYQDVNYGQQQLVRLLAGTHADVMVVGDDDQTIYEWRAARPHYILKGFKQDFNNKPVVDYPLSHTFRFGPLLAQAAQNVISFNQQREKKPLIAHFPDRSTEIDVITASDSELEMAREVFRLVQSEHVTPDHIAVLGRTYAQLGRLQTVFVQHKIPFRVIGAVTIFDRDENRTLVDYIRLALAWDHPPASLRPLRSPDIELGTEDAAQSRTRSTSVRRRGPNAEAVRIVQSVANTPSRMIPRIVLQHAIDSGAQQGLSIGDCLLQLLDSRTAPLRDAQRDNFEDLVDCIRLIQEELARGAEAHLLLDKIIQRTAYFAHFERYYGEGLPSMDRQDSVRLFVEFAKSVGLTAVRFIEYLRTLDTKQGLTDDQVITMSSIHKTKGLDFDYVFMPACLEGYHPVHISDNAGVYDKEGIVPDHPSSDPIENERRLFYVGMTRAVSHVYLGAREPEVDKTMADALGRQNSRFLEELQLAPTRDLVKFVQEGRVAEFRGLAPLLERYVRPWADRHQLVRSVVTNYMSGSLMGDTARAVLALLSQKAEVVFTYAHQYPQVDMRGKFVLPPQETGADEQTNKSPWDHIGITL